MPVGAVAMEMDTCTSEQAFRDKEKENKTSSPKLQCMHVEFLLPLPHNTKGFFF